MSGMKLRLTSTLPLFCFLLASCGETPVIPSSDIQSEESISKESPEVISTLPSESIDSLESEVTKGNTPEEIEAILSSITSFNQEIAAYEGTVQSTSYSSKTVTSFGAIDGDPIVIEGIVTGETKRCYLGSTKILWTFGSENIEGDVRAFETQRFIDGNYLYELKRYEDGEGAKDSEFYNSLSKKDYFNLSFSYQIAELLTSFSAHVGAESSLSTITAPEIDGDGDYSLLFDWTLFNQDIIDQKIAYEITFSIANSVVTSSKESLNNVLYLLGEPHQSLSSEISKTYVQGDPLPFTGTLFNPREF